MKTHGKVGRSFSVDVIDLFYSVPHEALFPEVKECIERNDPVSFQNSAGISIDDFLTGLRYYLESTFITFGQPFFLQKAGVCFGSFVAPVFCNIFLSQMDQGLHLVLPANTILMVFRYVDDFSIILTKDGSVDLPETVDNVLSLFRQHGKGLDFTSELPERNGLQFLNLNIEFCTHVFCWGYVPCAKKGVLPFDSSHSKLVK